MFFDLVNEAPPDPIFGLTEAFMADPRKEKINLAVGIYKDDQLRAEMLNSVRVAKNQIQDFNADYLPMDGLGEMIELLGPVIFDQPNWEKNRSRIYGAHVPGGTAALRIGAEFISQEVNQFFYIPNHTWPNHRLILEKAGCKWENYSYYSREKKGFDFEAMCAFLSKLAPKSVILLHACCHNPTGCDPTREEWKAISQLMKERKLLPFFDFAYQGFGQGLDKDAESVRIFIEDGHEMLIAYSCSKNFSMYCQRVGALYIVSENKAVKSHIQKIIRPLYSNPPAHGAKVVAEVLKNEELKKGWVKDLETIRKRVHLMREALIQRLKAKVKEINFDYLKKHNGMFSFVDMDKAQVHRMVEEFAIYITDNGRISIPGLSAKNIDYVVNSLAVCVRP